jgi:ribonuclease R
MPHSPPLMRKLHGKARAAATALPQGLPSREAILAFIASSPTPVGKREIGKAFKLDAHEKVELKILLNDMADEGLLAHGKGRAFHKQGGVPRVCVLKIIASDDGLVWGIPEDWQGDAAMPAPKIRVLEKGKRAALTRGDRVLVQTQEAGTGVQALVMKKLEKASAQILGVVQQDASGRWLKPVEKGNRNSFIISEMGEARPGQLVQATVHGRAPRLQARVEEVLGDPFAAKSISLIAIHKYNLPLDFNAHAEQEAAQAAAQPLGTEREDLTALPILAIDPRDARDHDDAIWAEPDGAGGFHALVAIADVSAYVLPGSALDREARTRGNSCYFPDRVVPMLPEALSAGACSLRAGEPKAALVCHMHISAHGKVSSTRFARATINVRANLVYEDAQAMIDSGEGDAHILAPLRNLWAAWQALYSARKARQPLEINVPERQVKLNARGQVIGIKERSTIDANRVIEEFMIAANVAAALTLEARKAPVMYRVHEQPARSKLESLKDYLASFEIKLALGQVMKPQIFNHILARAAETPFAAEIAQAVLRSQAQAVYTPENCGHFGLALGSYAHFTSPIRRYADVLVHRALVSAYKLGEGGLPADEAARMKVTGEHLSHLERRAMEAERETIDRYIASYLAAQVGQVLQTRITGVTKFGFFASVEGVGGDGLVPAATLGAEYFDYDEVQHKLIGQSSGETYAMGQRLELRLVEADVISGALKFELPEGASHMPFHGAKHGNRGGKSALARGRKKR